MSRVYASRFPKSVTDASNRFDIVAELAQFLAQSDYLDINRSVRDDRIGAANFIDELVPAVHPAGSTRQRHKQQEFGWSQIKGLVVCRYGVSAEVNDDLAGPDHTRAVVLVDSLATHDRPMRATRTRGLNGLVM
jgi:hypothetical protein